MQESFFLYSDQRAEILIKMGRGIRRGKLVKRLAGNSEKQMEKALEAFYETLQVVDKVRSMQNKPSRSNYY